MRVPAVAVGDGALGSWGAIRDVLPETRDERCWVHNIATRRQAAEEPAAHGEAAL
jgi:transposase-like protein